MFALSEWRTARAVGGGRIVPRLKLVAAVRTLTCLAKVIFHPSDPVIILALIDVSVKKTTVHVKLMYSKTFVSKNLFPSVVAHSAHSHSLVWFMMKYQERPRSGIFVFFINVQNL